MVDVLRRELGRQGRDYDPNKYAAERIAIPLRKAWVRACEANTIEAYKRFKKVWPMYRSDADKHIRELKYPRHVRKTISALFWIAWIALALFIIGFYVV
jgi:hypothetical protein